MCCVLLTSKRKLFKNLFQNITFLRSNHNNMKKQTFCFRLSCHPNLPPKSNYNIPMWAIKNINKTKIVMLIEGKKKLAFKKSWASIRWKQLPSLNICPVMWQRPKLSNIFPSDCMANTLAVLLPYRCRLQDHWGKLTGSMQLRWSDAELTLYWSHKTSLLAWQKRPPVSSRHLLSHKNTKQLTTTTTDAATALK